MQSAAPPGFPPRRLTTGVKLLQNVIVSDKWFSAIENPPRNIMQESNRPA